MSDLSEPVRLNPAQQRVTDELGAKRHERPSFRDDLGDHLRHELTETIGPVLAGAEQAQLPFSVNKYDLMLLHSCEARFVAQQQAEFAWSVPLARGAVAHKAIELLVAWRGQPAPLDLVEAALARLELEERGVGQFIGSLSEAERAELAGQANDYVATFLDTFPPLSRRWVPVTESRVRAELCDDRITLVGRVDLSLGKADGNTAGKVLIDLKTGRPAPTHIEDLRYYALLETLKIGVPPRLLVNYYLDAGEPRRELVTEDLLWSTAKRTVDAVAKMAELTAGPSRRSPTTTPGSGCRWCPALDGCDDGQHHLAQRDDAVSS